MGRADEYRGRKVWAKSLSLGLCLEISGWWVSESGEFRVLMT